MTATHPGRGIRDRDGDGRDESRAERIDRELMELLNELRVALPGVQFLFAFLLVVPFQQGGARMTDFQRDVYFVTLMAAVVATAGSAPAYVFLLAELIAAHGAEMGLDAASAEAMAAATVKGAGIMLQQEGARAEALRKAVMSPNGTTEKAVEAFLDGGMGDLVNRAMDAAAQRDKEMAEEFGA